MGSGVVFGAPHWHPYVIQNGSRPPLLAGTGRIKGNPTKPPSSTENTTDIQYFGPRPWRLIWLKSPIPNQDEILRAERTQTIEVVKTMSYAIIADGGRQYKVEAGQKLEIDYREVEPGGSIVFDRVLAVSSDKGFQLGKPTVEGAKVTAKVIGETKGDKIYVQKFRRRKNSKRRTGHRQKYVEVQIDSIG